VRFEETRRWLRGRIVGRLSQEADGGWVEMSGPIGVHSAASVEAALLALVADGVLERDTRGAVRLAQGAAGSSSGLADGDAA
jgi:hypothetical protein